MSSTMSSLRLLLPRRAPRSFIPASTLTPFLYPSFILRSRSNHTCAAVETVPESAAESEIESAEEESVAPPLLTSSDLSHPSTANPSHPHHQFTYAPFADLRTIQIQSGNGGNGCVSFLRDKFLPHGPPNGGDGGTGGSVYIQAIYGETSLHKLGRQGVIQATNGQNGKGSALGGKRGEDVVIRVPVGTVVRELSRFDPVEEEIKRNLEEGLAGDAHDSRKWMHYPNAMAGNLADDKFTSAKYPVDHHHSSSELLKLTHPTAINLDLSEPTPKPILLLPGAPGGLGNPHFVSAHLRRPKFATRGSKGSKMTIQLELKVLADVGLVGFPNAGKSSFLRAVSKRKARVGEWAFTTLTPNIGTVVVDERFGVEGKERFTIADIPGIVEDAHQDRGLGISFLRHIERARMLAFVVDLSNPDPLADLQALWREVKEYEAGLEAQTLPEGMVQWKGAEWNKHEIGKAQKPREKMSDKPWFVIANKADVDGTQEKFMKLREGAGADVVPISALEAQGVETAVDMMKALLKI